MKCSAFIHRPFTVCVAIALLVVPGFAVDGPIVLDKPALISAPANDHAAVFYKAQPAKDGKIDLTAANGFFDRCFEAVDTQPAVPGDEGFINCSFGALARMSEKVSGTARWHLYCPDAGQIQASFVMQVPPDEAGHNWAIALGNESQTLKANPSDGKSPQAQTLLFNVKQAGKVTFTIDCRKDPPAAQTRIRFIRLEGSAIVKASLLRTRWRPGAVHVHYFAPANCPSPRMWVFETVDLGKTGSYSPLTTPFGYYGTSFSPGGVVPAGAGFNFSMWIAGRGAEHAPPVEKMARLIATDLPDAEYSTFGGEGTGVKFRGGAYAHAADRVIQALRIETANDLQTYYGYFYDESEHRWKLFASAQSPQKHKGGSGLLNSTGSFCEIPGPPNRERSGDLVREIKRRGWFFGQDRKWYRSQLAPDAPDSPERIDDLTGAEPAAEKPAAHVRGKARRAADPNFVSDQRACYMADYPLQGWMSMATGGMEFYHPDPTRRVMPSAKDAEPAFVPEYLTPEKTAQLFDLPVQFGPCRASSVSSDSAVIDCEIKKTGLNSRAVLYYGTVDAITYPAKTVTKGSAAEIDMFRPERTWQHATAEQAVAIGVNQFHIPALKPATTYYCRIYVHHDQGKSWAYDSFSFQTR